MVLWEDALKKLIYCDFPLNNSANTWNIATKTSCKTITPIIFVKNDDGLNEVLVIKEII